MNEAKTLIVGIGNRYRGDDAFGCLVACEVAKMAPSHVNCIEHDGEPASLIDCWRDMEEVILIDAVSSGAEPGHIFRFDLSNTSLPDAFNLYSTHSFGVPQAVELARTLKKLPTNIVFLGVEGQSFSAGKSLSEPVKAAQTQLVAEILNQLRGD